MEFCILVEPHNGADYDDQLRVALAAERLGYAGFFRADHLIAGQGDGLPGPTETWVTLAGLAIQTSTIRIGSLMTSATFRHPSVLAAIVAQVDRMSGGRVDFGFGAGWWDREHRATGIALPDPTERFDRFSEQLEIISGLWSAAGTFSFSGRYFTLDRSPALPKPLQDDVPIIIGGDGKKRTPALAARFAGEYNCGWEDPETTTTLFDRARNACAAIGRDPNTLRLSTVQTPCIGATAADRERRAAAIGTPSGERVGALTGDASDVARQLHEFAEVGVDRIYLELLDLDDIAQLEYFANDVIPML
ncbi:MAG: LLM class F420-dependent oxidoreductase [Nakamurella sp.]